MSSPFLVSFVEAVLSKLVEAEQIELQPGSAPGVVQHVASRLGRATKGESLISTLSSALLECEGVDELYADDMTLKDLVTDLPRTALPRGGGS